MSGGVDIGCLEEDLKRRTRVNGVVPLDLIGVENLKDDDSPFGKKCKKCLEKKGLVDCPRKEN